MLECSTHADTLRAGPLLRFGNLVMLPIERVVLNSYRDGTHAWISAVLEPHAMIVREAGGTRAIGTGAVATSLEDLQERVPGLDGLLAAM